MQQQVPSTKSDRSWVRIQELASPTKFGGKATYQSPLQYPVKVGALCIG